jgi:NADPH:quinone reductase-like Zn-dependent oxidoreductase
MALPTSMRAWQYETASGGLENNLKLVTDAQLPSHDNLSPSQVLVRVHAASINPVDYKMVEMPVIGPYMVKLPATPGKDFAGIVAQVSPENNTNLATGQQVFGRIPGQPRYGALGEYIIVDVGVDACVPLPAEISFEDGAAFGTAGTAAMQSIKPFLPDKGGAVFINGGAAGTGTFAIQFSKALGATQIVTTCSTNSVQFCKDLGATECIDYRTTNVVEALKNYGPIFDVAVDFIGNPTNLYQQSHHFVKPDGQFIQIGATPNAAGIISLLAAQYQPKFLGGGTRKYAFLRSQNVKEDFELAAKWMQEKKAMAIIDSVHEFEHAVEAYKKLKSGRAKGKIIVKGPATR